jgi:hypothetical protein
MSTMDQAHRGEGLHNRCFRFEADFVGDLRCLPMAVRRKLDLAGVKLRLSHWHALTSEERERLLHWLDDPAAVRDLRVWLLERSADLPGGPAGTLDPVSDAGWQRTDHMPEVVSAACAQIGATVTADDWLTLDELQRFALVKLSHPGHEHRNLPRALEEFDLPRSVAS